MKQQSIQVHIIDRVMHLLEERSVLHQVREDEAFADQIARLYETADLARQQLVRAH